MATAPLLASIMILATFGGNRKDSKPKPSPNTTSMQGLVNHATIPSISKLLTRLSRTPTFRNNQEKIYCRTGYLLVVLPDGHVMGTINSTIASKYGSFELQSFGSSVIRMQNTATKRYVGINKRGKVFSSILATNETLLEETHLENHFFSYRSHIYGDKKNKRHWYLAIKRNGKMKNARKVSPRHKSFQFLTPRKRRKIDSYGRQLLNSGIMKLFETA